MISTSTLIWSGTTKTALDNDYRPFPKNYIPVCVEYIKDQPVVFQIENDDIAIMDQSSSFRLFSYHYSSIIIVTSLAQCSHKKPRIQDRKDKIEIKKKMKNAHTPASEEKIRDKQDKSNSPDEKKRAALEEQHTSAVEDAEKEKERLKEMGEKRIEEIKPKIMKRNAKEERIAKGKETRGKGDYPTMDDVLSDWDSERDGKKKNEDDDQKSRANTNLEDVDDMRKNEEKKPAENGDAEEKKKEDKGGEKKEIDSRGKSSGRDTGKYATKGSIKNAKGPSDSIKKVDKTAGSQVKKFIFEMISLTLLHISRN
ncbi:unnamed protein product [Brugia pahangi]|uniref:BLVR domain-containing protein n=1 Tax=Brugia pahangi TaxID=6280 RepID=A0A0N4T332_BRUPA|nr:unnamed protein product [Brugia pahangi]